MQTIGEGRGSWLVHQSQNFQSGDFPRILGSLALGIIEIRGHGNHRTINGFAKKNFCPILQFTQDECGNLRRGENFFTQPDANDVAAGRIEPKRKKLQFVLNILYAAAHQAFYRINRALRLGEKPAARRFANDDAPVRIKAHHRRTKCRAVRPDDTLRLFRLRVEIRDETVGGTKIDSDHASHAVLDLGQFFGHVRHQVANVGPAIQ